MKKTIAMCALALMTIGLSSAHASDEANTRNVRFNFSCPNMLGVKVAADGTAIPTTGPVFDVYARVFADVEHGRTPDLSSLTASSSARNLNNYIAILKNGDLVFADMAVLYSNVKDVVITGSNGTSPALIVKRAEHTMTYDAALKFGDHIVAEGTCTVSTTPVVDEEVEASVLQ